mgnify:CR=1 FL=1
MRVRRPVRSSTCHHAAGSVRPSSTSSTDAGAARTPPRGIPTRSATPRPRSGRGHVDLARFAAEEGKRVSTKLNKWEVVSCPAGILHGFENEGSVDVYMQTFIGTGKPGPVGYADDRIYAEETQIGRAHV